MRENPGQLFYYKSYLLRFSYVLDQKKVFLKRLPKEPIKCHFVRVKNPKTDIIDLTPSTFLI